FHFKPEVFIKRYDDLQFVFHMDFLPHATGGIGGAPAFPFWVRLRIKNDDGDYYYLSQPYYGANTDWGQAINDDDPSFPFNGSRYDDNFDPEAMTGFVVRNGIRVNYR